MEEEYLGDGVYASFDGYHIVLDTKRTNMDHKIYIEPAVMNALNTYAAKVFAKPE